MVGPIPHPMIPQTLLTLFPLLVLVDLVCLLADADPDLSPDLSPSLMEE